MTLRPFIKIVLGIALVGMTAVVVISKYIRARIEDDSSRPPPAYRQCVDHNLPAIAKATQRWAIAKRKGLRTTPTPDDLLPYLEGNRFPVCPAGGIYELGPAESHPACSLPAHPWVAQ